MHCPTCVERKPNSSIRILNLFLIGAAVIWSLLTINGGHTGAGNKSESADTLRAGPPPSAARWEIRRPFTRWIEGHLENSFGIRLQLIREVSNLRSRFLAFSTDPGELVPIVESRTVYRLLNSGSLYSGDADTRLLHSYRPDNTRRIVTLPVRYFGREATLKIHFLAEPSIVYSILEYVSASPPPPLRSLPFSPRSDPAS